MNSMETFESPVYAFQPQSSPLQRNSVLKWSVITGAWILLGVIYVIPIYLEVRAEGMGHSFVRIFAWGILSWLVWAPLTPAIIALARRFPLVVQPSGECIHVQEDRRTEPAVDTDRRLVRPHRGETLTREEPESAARARQPADERHLLRVLEGS